MFWGEGPVGSHPERNNLNLPTSMLTVLTLFLLAEKVNTIQNLNHVKSAGVPCIKVGSILDIKSI